MRRSRGSIHHSPPAPTLPRPPALTTLCQLSLKKRCLATAGAATIDSAPRPTSAVPPGLSRADWFPGEGRPAPWPRGSWSCSGAPFPTLRRTQTPARRISEVSGGSGVIRRSNARQEGGSRSDGAAGEGGRPGIPGSPDRRLLDQATRLVGALKGRIGLFHAFSVEIWFGN